MVLERPAGDSKSVDGDSCQRVNIRVPKRILHFSDGILEEYSDDEDTSPPKNDTTTVVDASTLAWGPWFLHQVFGTGKMALFVCDYIGETLASILGITSPKYQYEIEEYEKMQAEQKKIDEINNDWTKQCDVELTKITEQPQGNSPVSPI